jgi:ribosome biogenesis GTPase A
MASLNWFPGHMNKARKELAEVLPSVDLLIEVLDARIPFSSQNPMLQALRGDKPCIKVLTKTDLADPVITQEWQSYLEQEQGVKTLAVTTQQPEKIKQLAELCRKLAPHKEDKGQSIQALIMGIPNVGKSTLINTMAGKAVAKAGNEPAVTKGQQRINLRNGIILWDTPGMLWPKIESEKSSYRLAVSGAIKDTAMEYEDVACFAAEYLLSAYPDNLRRRYELDQLPASDIEFLELIGSKRGCLGAGGRVDFNKIAKILLTELRAGTLGQISLERPAMMEAELIEVARAMEEREAQKAAKKAQKKTKKGKRS